MLRPRLVGLRPGELLLIHQAWGGIARGRRARGRSSGRVVVVPSELGGRDVCFPPITRAEAAIVIEAMGAINCVAVRGGGAKPLTRGVLESRRLRYIRYDPRETWYLLRQVWENGGGDCEDLAAGLVGSLRAKGRRARAIILPPKDGISHVVVELPNGRRLDPSIWGGMGSPTERAEAAAMGGVIIPEVLAVELLLAALLAGSN